MKSFKGLVTVMGVLLVFAGFAAAGSIGMKLSGPGAVNDTTIKAGEPVAVDIYVENDSLFTGFSFGFAIKSKDIKKIVHVADSAGGLNEAGDIKGHNGWQDHSVWNFGGVHAVERNWDGELPELIGFGGLCVQQEYKPHEKKKCISLNMIVPTPGTLTLDSAYYPPGGRWLFATPKPGAAQEPAWEGPYNFKVVK